MIISHKTDADFYPVEYENTIAEQVSLRIFPNFSLCYIIEGSINYTINKAAFKAESGDMYVLFPSMPISITPNGECIITRIECSGSRTASLLNRAGINYNNPVMKNVTKSISDRMAEFREVADFRNAAADLSAQIRLFQLMSTIIDSVTKTTISHIEKDKQMADAIQYINDNYMNPDFSVVDVANHVGFNTNYMSRKFKEYTGKPFSKYLIEVRLGHACTLMEEGIHSIKQVAELTGYSNQLYFSKEFKKEAGCTPKEYRARFKPDKEDKD